MQLHEKTAILKGLKAQEVARLKEQDTYRAILRDIENAPQTDSLSDHLGTLGWEGIEKHMEGQCWPPTSQDWLKFDGLEYYETPKQKILNQIADKDIRFSTYHYSELADHTLRIKAMAHFYSLFAATNDDVALTFWVWKECSKVNAMHEQKASDCHSASQCALSAN